MHSTFSDGSLTPEELVAMAAEKGIRAIALTDHDSVKGVDRFLRAAEARRMLAIGGVEISADTEKGTMHMLGYNLRHTDPDLRHNLDWICGGREARNHEILDRLEKLGLPMTWEEVAAYAGEDNVGRPHFAMALVARGYVRDKDEAFNRYLARGRPAYAERRRLSPAESIELLLAAGGVPVLAHPFTLDLRERELRVLLMQLKDVGLQGIEAYYAEYSSDMQNTYMKLARELDLVMTGGSDFHGAANPKIHMGVGFGSLVVPDDLVDTLLDRGEALRKSRAAVTPAVAN